MSPLMSLIEFSLTTTIRGIRLATRPCIPTNEYQRETDNLRCQFLAWATSSSRSLVIGWWRVTIVGIIRSIPSTPYPRHWLSWTRSKSATRRLSS